MTPTPMNMVVNNWPRASGCRAMPSTGAPGHQAVADAGADGAARQDEPRPDQTAQNRQTVIVHQTLSSTHVSRVSRGLCRLHCQPSALD